MLIIAVKIKRIAVKAFAPKEGVDFIVTYDNGAEDKDLEVSMTLKDLDAEIKDLIIDIKKLEKRTEGNYLDDDDVTSGTVVRIVDNDEEEVEKKIKSFLMRVKQKMTEVLTYKSSANYLNRINEVRSMKLEF